MGGAAKQMMHPYDDLDMTFGQMTELIMNISFGNIDAVEKVDGLNIHWYLNKDNAPCFARNMTEIKARGIPLKEIRRRMETHPGGVQFLEGINAIAERATAMRWRSPRGGQHWINTEIVSCNYPQTIKYDHSALVYHDYVMMNREQNGMISCARPYSREWRAFLEAEEKNPHAWESHHKLAVTLPTDPLADYVFAAIKELRSICNHWSLTSNGVLRDYYWAITVRQCQNLGLSKELSCMVADNVWNGEKYRIQDIKKALPKEIHDQLDKIALSKHRQGYQGKCKARMRKLWDCFGSKIIEQLPSNLIADTEAARKRLDDLVRFNIIQASEIHVNTHPEIWSELQDHLDRFESLNVECPVMEGVVIPYNGNTYKLTGAFPSMNRICGAVRYPLGIDFETHKEETFANAY
jgi:hypothetical protein